MFASVVYNQCISITSSKQIISYFRPFLYKFSDYLFHAQQLSRYSSTVSKMGDQVTSLFEEYCRRIAPPLEEERYKGQAGKIGVIGGSLEYTGAPYFAAISSLKIGADIVHVFCAQEAGIVIKTYSPELIVHPILDTQNAVEKIKPWLTALNGIVIGPGLGREPAVFKVIDDLLDAIRDAKLPLVIDADGLYYITQRSNALFEKFQTPIILTPNKVEYARLLSLPFINNDPGQFFNTWGDNITILIKGHEDIILTKSQTVKVIGGGSGRRCGGQGDLLAGSLTVFLNWALQNKEFQHDKSLCSMLASFAACRLIRSCNARAFSRLGRSMTASDMVEEIHPVFVVMYERS